jgi:hypothetical protein
MHAALLDMIPTIAPEMFAGSPMEQEYRRLAWPEDDVRGFRRRC